MQAAFFGKLYKTGIQKSAKIPIVARAANPSSFLAVFVL